LILSASACHFGSRIWSAGLLSKARLWFQTGLAKPIACVCFGMSDATDLRLRVEERSSSASPRNSPEQYLPREELQDQSCFGSRQVTIEGEAPSPMGLTYTKSGKLCKLFNSYFAIAFVMYVPATMRYVTMVNPLTSPLQVCDNGFADSYKALLDGAAFVPLWGACQRSFPMAFDLRTLDQDAANIKAENATNFEKEDTARALHPCEIHITSIVQRGSYQPISPDITGMIATVLVARPNGAFPKLQEAAEIVLQGSLKVVPSGPPPCTDPRWEHRAALLDLLLTDSRSDNKRRADIEKHLNGDWSSKEVFWFTEDLFPDLKAWAERSVHAILPTPPDLFNRGRWMKSTTTMRAFALLANCHSLLERSVPLWLQLLSHVPRARLTTPRNILVAKILDEPRGPWVVDDDSDDEIERKARTSTIEPTSPEDWVLYNTRQRNKAADWAERQPAHRLLISVVSFGPAVRIMEGQLEVAGRAWQEKQFYNATVSGKRPLYRMTDAASCRLTNRFHEDAKHLLLDASKWTVLPEAAITQGNASLAFAMVGKAMCGMQQLLHKLHTKLPVQLFNLLGDGVHKWASALANYPDCLKEDLAVYLFERFDDVEKLSSQVALIC
jgi:hypothetical protein